MAFSIETCFIGAWKAFVTAVLSFDSTFDTAGRDTDIQQVERTLTPIDSRVKSERIDPEL